MEVHIGWHNYEKMCNYYFRMVKESMYEKHTMRKLFFYCLTVYTHNSSIISTLQRTKKKRYVACIIFNKCSIHLIKFCISFDYRLHPIWLHFAIPLTIWYNYFDYTMHSPWLHSIPLGYSLYPCELYVSPWIRVCKCFDYTVYFPRLQYLSP